MLSWRTPRIEVSIQLLVQLKKVENIACLLKKHRISVYKMKIEKLSGTSSDSDSHGCDVKLCMTLLIRNTEQLDDIIGEMSQWKGVAYIQNIADKF